MRIRLVIGFLIALVAVAPSLGETPLTTAFTYQGQLKQNGIPVNGTVNMVISLWDAATDGNPIGPIVDPAPVQVTNGVFTVQLDYGNVFNGDARWLQIAVNNPAGGGGFSTLAPRQPLTAAPHALFALNADRLDGLDSTAFLQSIPVPLTLSGTSDTHIIRVQNASSTHSSTAVFGESTGTGNTYGVFGQSPNGRGVYGTTVRGIGVFGEATDTGFLGTTYGVYGASSGQFGIGVRGFAGDAGTAGNTTGVWGETASTIGVGVRGRATAATGVTYGVYGESLSTSGLGVFGQAGASNWGNFNAPAGVWGDAADGNGVLGTGTNGTGVAGVSTFGRGVFAFSQSGDALEAVASGQFTTAIWGRHDRATGSANGVFGESASTDGRGVYGYASAGSGTPYGVYGFASLMTAGYGVFADGDMGASGTKPFRIDHPDDPENKYLLHYAAESPEVINFYRGTVTLDGAGEAVVELPHYFAKINKTPSYQLTAVGAPMPMLHVAEKINEAALSAGATAGAGVAAPACTFRISGGAPGGEVSWRVEALRNDLWVQKRAVPMEVVSNGLSIQTRAMPVEVEKQGVEKGTYQHPELYGQPPEKGMNYDARAERDLHNHPKDERAASRALGKALTP